MKKEILNSTILLWILGSIDILLLVMWAIIDGRLPKYLFGVDNPKANGDFLTICFSVIGGGAVIYGLYLNNKRIGEQTRQNDITVDGNNSKRFGDAVGYLANENKSIVIGGIYALYQLAKDNNGYRSLVANIFINYLNSTSSTLYTKTKEIDKPNLQLTSIVSSQDTKFIFQAIIDCLFDKEGIFTDESLEINNASLLDIKFKNPINNVKFESCELVGCEFNLLRCCEFSNTSFDNSCLKKNIHSSQFNCCSYNYCLIYGDIIDSSISTSFSPNHLDIFSNEISNSSFSIILDTISPPFLDDCNKFNFRNCTFTDSIIYGRNNALLIHCKNEPEFE